MSVISLPSKQQVKAPIVITTFSIKWNKTSHI